MANLYKPFDGEISKDNPAFIEYIKTNIDETVKSDTYKHMSMFEGVLAHHGLYTRRFANKTERAERIVYEKDGGLKSKIEYFNKPQLMAIYEARKSLESQFDHDNLEFIGSSSINPELSNGAEAVAKYLTKIWQLTTKQHADLSRISHWWSGRMVMRTTLDEKQRPQSLYVSPFSWFYSKDFLVDPEEASFQFTRVFASPQKAFGALGDNFKDFEDFKTKTGAYLERWDNVFDPSVMLNNLYLAKVDHETRNILGSLFPDFREFVFYSPWEKIPVYEYYDKALGIKIMRVGDWFGDPEPLFDFNDERDFSDESAKYKYPLTGVFFNRDGYTLEGVSDVEQTLPYEKVLNNVLSQTLKSYRTQMDPLIFMKSVGVNPILIERNEGFDGNLLMVKNSSSEPLSAQTFKVDQSIDFNIHSVMRDIFEGRILRGMGTSPTLELQPVKYSTAAEIGQIQQSAYASISKKNIKMLGFYETVARKMGKLAIENIDSQTDGPMSLGSDMFYYAKNAKVKEKDSYWEYTIPTKKGDLVFYKDKKIPALSDLVEDILEEKQQPTNPDIFSGIINESIGITPSDDGKPDMSFSDLLGKMGGGGEVYMFMPDELANIDLIIDLKAREGVLSEKALQARQILQFIPYVKNPRMQLGLVNKAMKLSGIDPKELYDEAKIAEDIDRQSELDKARVNQSISPELKGQPSIEGLQQQNPETAQAPDFQEAFNQDSAAQAAIGDQPQ